MNKSRPRRTDLFIAALRARLRSGAKSSHERVLATCSGVSQARRAVAMPYCRRSKFLAEWASESTRIITPASAAARAWISFMSRRSGAALISIIVPFAAAAAITRVMSIA